jgi:TolB-like protein/cytochrome c-type biogenesis protein CcmH/NrfG
MSEVPKAVFLSYASQDAAAAKRICEALRQAGVEVWFDQSELVGGDAWDAKIKKQIKDCALFVPIISANTQARAEGYFRREWKLAAERTHDMADHVAFLLPVVLDKTMDREAHVPAKFCEVQWTRLPGGETPPAFAERVKKLLGGTELEVHRPRHVERGGGGPPPSRPWLVPVIIIGVAAGLAVAIWQPWRSGPQPAIGVAPLRDSEIQRAAALIDFNKVDTTVEDFKLAEQIIQESLTRHPTDPPTVTLAAWLENEFIIRGFDGTDERLTLARRYSEQAAKLAPESPEAIAALGFYYLSAGSDLPRAEQLLRRAITLDPREPKYHRLLGWTIRAWDRRGERIQLMEQAAKIFPRDALVRYDLAMVRFLGEDYDGAEKTLDEAIALEPIPTAIRDRAWLSLWWHGDVAGMKSWLDRMPERFRADDMTALACYVEACVSGRPEGALGLLQGIPGAWLHDHEEVPKNFLMGDLLLLQGKTELARGEFEAALAEVKRARTRDPANPNYLQFELWSLYRLGHIAEARSELAALLEAAGKTGFDPHVGNFWFGPFQAALLLGEKAKALDHLRTQVPTVPRRFARNALRVDPRMAPWRDDPEIKALLAEPVENTAVAPDLSTKALATVDQKSVAVLAFANLSDDKGNEYFSDGISEELLNVLAKIPGLKVTARTSSFHFKGKDTPIPEIAAKLNVAYVVEGSVRKAGDKVRITAQLIKAADGFHVWSETFTRDLKDIFAVQDEIAGLIAKNLQLKLGDAPRAAKAVNPEAHQLYLQGKYFLNQYSHDNAQRATDLLQRAVELDSEFALAWVALSRAHSVRGGFADSLPEVDESFVLARRAAERALVLEPDLAAAHLALAEVQIDHDFDWKGATGSLRRAQALAPTDASVIDTATRLAYAVGQTERAAELGGQAVALDPVNPAARIYYGFALADLRRFSEAETQFRRVIELNPNIPWGHAGVSFTFIHQGRFDEAAAEAVLETNEWSRLLTLALARWGQKKLPEADAALAQLIKGNADVAAFQVAEAYAFRHDNDRAFEWLERAYRQRDAGLAWSKSDIILESLHADPRWEAFLRKLGLADDQLK